MLGVAEALPAEPKRDGRSRLWVLMFGAWVHSVVALVDPAKNPLD